MKRRETLMIQGEIWEMWRQDPKILYAWRGSKQIWDEIADAIEQIWEEEEARSTNRSGARISTNKSRARRSTQSQVMKMKKSGRGFKILYKNWFKKTEKFHTLTIWRIHLGEEGKILFFIIIFTAASDAFTWGGGGKYFFYYLCSAYASDEFTWGKGEQINVE